MKEKIEILVDMLDEGFNITNYIMKHGKKEIDEDDLVSISFYHGCIWIIVLGIPLITLKLIFKLIFKIIKLKIKK